MVMSDEVFDDDRRASEDVRKRVLRSKCLGVRSRLAEEKVVEGDEGGRWTVKSNRGNNSRVGMKASELDLEPSHVR